MIRKENIYKNMLRLVEVPSVSGTDKEVQAAYKLQELLYEIPYFDRHSDSVKLVPLENDPFGRCIVTAYLDLDPDCQDTVILTGHYDVVDVEEYGHLMDVAYDVEKITECINRMPLDQDSLKDFESGEWLFGRGTADMKYGHALCIELLKHFSEEGGIKGKLLYAAVCGEETNSEGMLRAVPFFNELAAEKKLKYTALLLTECYMTEDQANDTNRYIHYGASGKVMPMYFFVGEATHGGEPFLGIDPCLISAEVYRELELNTGFCQQSLGETTPPPVCLKFQDLKSTYSASTPLYAAAYYSIISIHTHPEEVMNRLMDIGRKAFENALEFMKVKADKYEKLTGERPVTHPVTVCVKTFYDIYSEVKGTYSGNLDADIKKYALRLSAEKFELQDICVKIVKKVYELYKDKRPMVIVSIIPPYYPDVYIDKNEKNAAHLLKCVGDIIQYAGEKYGETLKMKDYYMGISDLSYTSLAKDMNFDKLLKNIVGANMIYQLPSEALKRFSVPGIVLGGYGKDFHKHTERLHINYNFNVLPDLYVQLIKKIFNKQKGKENE